LLALTMASTTSSSGPSPTTGLGPDYVLGRELFLTALPPKNVRRRGRSLASRQRPREQLRNRNESMMIRRTIPTTMILLLLRNASVDVGRLRRHIFVAIVLVVMGSQRQGQHQPMIIMMPRQQLPIAVLTMSVSVAISVIYSKMMTSTHKFYSTWNSILNNTRKQANLGIYLSLLFARGWKRILL